MTKVWGCGSPVQSHANDITIPKVMTHSDDGWVLKEYGLLASTLDELSSRQKENNNGDQFLFYRAETVRSFSPRCSDGRIESREVPVSIANVCDDDKVSQLRESAIFHRYSITHSARNDPAFLRRMDLCHFKRLELLLSNRLMWMNDFYASAVE